MITTHSVDLRYVTDPCFGLQSFGLEKGCKVMKAKHPKCGTYKCPFYKPDGFEDWVRFEDKQGVNLIPPEEGAAGRR